MADVKISALTGLDGASASAADSIPIVDADAGATKRILLSQLFASFPVVITTEMDGASVATTDELLLSDAGVPKTITIAELIQAIMTLGVDLADVPEYADQAAAQAGLTGTGKLFRFATTGALGITIA